MLQTVAEPQANIAVTAVPVPKTLKMLSYNIQVGIRTGSYPHYLTKAWQHILPSPFRQKNLNEIGELLRDFDLVALQEADGGSLRSGFVNQVEYLAERAEHPYWYHQCNRNMGIIAKHSNGMMSREQPLQIESHSLPGPIPGRGAIEVHMGDKANPLTVVMMHLSLGRKAQDAQLSFIRELVQQRDNVVLMGDLNTHAEHLLNDSPLKDLPLKTADTDTKTYPSWKPERGLDHILVSSHLNVRDVQVLNHQVSDHLPVAMEIDLP